MAKTAEEWVKQADLYNTKGEYEDSIRCSDKAIAVDPNCGKAYAIKASAQFSLDEHQEAISNYHKALDFGYKEAWVYNDLGSIYIFNVSNREEGVKYCKLALELKPDDIGAHLNLARALTALGRIEEAKETFIASLKLKKRFTEAAAFVGSYREDEGSDEEAMKYYNIGFEICDYDFKCSLLKADLLRKQGKTKEAIDILNKNEKNNPNKPETYLRLGDIYLGLGNKDKAMKYYEKGASQSIEEFNKGNVDYCLSLGQCRNMVGKFKEAIECFNKAKEALESKEGIYPPVFRHRVEKSLSAIFEIEEMASKVESELSKADQNPSAVKECKVSYNLLKGKKADAQNKTLAQATKRGSNSDNQDFTQLERVKEELNELLAGLKKDQVEPKAEVKTDINTKNDMEPVKEELASKMDECHRAHDINIEPVKQDLGDDDKKKEILIPQEKKEMESVEEKQAGRSSCCNVF